MIIKSYCYFHVFKKKKNTEMVKELEKIPILDFYQFGLILEDFYRAELRFGF